MYCRTVFAHFVCLFALVEPVHFAQDALRRGGKVVAGMFGLLLRLGYRSFGLVDFGVAAELRPELVQAALLRFQVGHGVNLLQTFLQWLFERLEFGLGLFGGNPRQLVGRGTDGSERRPQRGILVLETDRNADFEGTRNFQNRERIGRISALLQAVQTQRVPRYAS
jgi:hypothetical protein